jgi:hypothetical protein
MPQINPTRRQLLAALAGAAVWPAAAQGPAASPGSRVALLEIRSPAGARSVLVPGCRWSLAGVRQPSVEVFYGVRRFVVEGFREPGYRSALMQPHPALDDRRRAPWAAGLSDEAVRRFGGRLLCSAPADFQDGSSAEFAAILLSRRSAWPVIEAALHDCSGRAVLSRTRHVLHLAEDRGLAVGGLERVSDLDERVLRLPERLLAGVVQRAFEADAPGRARQLAEALNGGRWSAVLEAFMDGAPDRAGANLLYRVLVAERNDAWMSRLVPLLERGDALVMVDAAHLGGEHGLIERLGQRGYRVALQWTEAMT